MCGSSDGVDPSAVPRVGTVAAPGEAGGQRTAGGGGSGRGIAVRTNIDISVDILHVEIDRSIISREACSMVLQRPSLGEGSSVTIGARECDMVLGAGATKLRVGRGGEGSEGEEGGRGWV